MIVNGEIERPNLNLLELKQNLSDFSAITDLFLCIPTFHFDTTTDFVDRDVWNYAIVHEEVIPIHDIFESLDQSEQISLFESKFNFREKIKSGKYRFLLSVCVNIDFYKKLKKYEGDNLKCFFGDINNNLYGVMSGSTVVPFDIDPLIIDKIYFGTGNQPSWTNILLSLSDPDQMLLAYIVKPDWFISELWNIECILELTGGAYLPVFNYTFETLDHLNIIGSPTGWEAVIYNNQLKITTPPTAGWVQVFPQPEDIPLLLSPNNYHLTINSVSRTGNIMYMVLYVYGDSPQEWVITPGVNDISFTTTGTNAIFLQMWGSSVSPSVYVIDNWLLENLTGSPEEYVLTVNRPDGDPITNLTIPDLSIDDDTNGDVTITTLTETEPGVYSVVTAEELTSGDIYLFSDYYNGEDDYNFGTTIYYNVIKSQVFTRNNCGEGYEGTEYNYIVPAGTYSSIISQADANQKALDDIAANGQNEANAHGSCVLIPPPYILDEQFDTWADGLPVNWVEWSSDLITTTNNSNRIDLTVPDPGEFEGTLIALQRTGLTDIGASAEIKVTIKVDSLSAAGAFYFELYHDLTSWSQTALTIGVNVLTLTKSHGDYAAATDSIRFYNHNVSSYPNNIIIDYITIEEL